jgi:hypothetical protein
MLLLLAIGIAGGLGCGLVAEVVGRIYKTETAPEGTPWMWALAYRYHAERSPTHGMAARIGNLRQPEKFRRHYR